jgi:hypothetical protein
MHLFCLAFDLFMMSDWGLVETGMLFFLESLCFWMESDKGARERCTFYVRLHLRATFRQEPLEGIVDNEGRGPWCVIFLDHLCLSNSTSLAFLSPTEVQLFIFFPLV